MKYYLLLALFPLSLLAMVPAPQRPVVKQPVKLTPLKKPAAAQAPVAKPAAVYRLEFFNAVNQQIRVELISKDGKTLVNEYFPNNGRKQWELDSNVFPLTLKVYAWQSGRDVKILEDEINMPAFNLPELQFYTVFDTEVRVKFVPNVPHGRPKAMPVTKPDVQPAVSQPQPAAAPSAGATRQPAPTFNNYEVRLENGSELPLKYKLSTQNGRILFNGNMAGKSKTQLFTVSPNDFPITVNTHDDTGMSFDHEFTFSLNEALSQSRESREWFAGNPRVRFGKENQFAISVIDLRPTRTEGMIEGHKAIHTRGHIGALTE